ncbi:MAG TPA: TMEM14 family protein [Fimbriimonadales bacterium]|nr:TMEM14 family protein [Fimbriimonadales bacterium]
MNWVGFVLLVYTVLVLAGGFYGYVAKGSLPSLISAVVADILITVGILLAVIGKQPVWGYGLGGGVALILGIFFAMRLAGGSLFPGLPMLILSLITVICVVYWIAASGAKP